MPTAALLRPLVVCALAAVAGQGLAASFLVSNLNDSGPGSLRQALLDANANPGFDTVDFASGLTGTVQLTSGQLVITDGVAVNGPGADVLAIDAGRASRVLHISNAVASIFGVTLQNGVAPPLQGGGGVFVSGGLIMSNSAVVDCEVPLNVGMSAEGGGILVDAGGALIMDRSLIANCRVGLGTGGGVRGLAGSQIEITNSTFSGNSATQGGALSSAGLVLINYSTFADNSATSAGGAVWAQPGSFEVGNSIVARNAAPSGPDWFGPASSLGFNIVANPAGSSGWNAQDLGGADPLLGALDFHGGPTRSYALLVNSPARDAGNPFAFPALDQRGMARPQGAGPDIGAFEEEEGSDPPIADAGPDQTVGQDGNPTQVELDGSGSSDPDGDDMTFEWFREGALIATGPAPTVGLPAGTHTITLVVTDVYGASDSDEVVIRVTDNHAPRIKFAFAFPRVLWPPRHDMRSVWVHYIVKDKTDKKPQTWLTVESDEADSGLGGGDKPNDIQIVNKHHVKLRAERDPSGDGRVYTITIHAKDKDGNVSTKKLRVVVPRRFCRWHR